VAASGRRSLVAIGGSVLLSAVVSVYFTPSVFLLPARAGQRR